MYFCEIVMSLPVYVSLFLASGLALRFSSLSSSLLSGLMFILHFQFLPLLVHPFASPFLQLLSHDCKDPPVFFLYLTQRFPSATTQKIQSWTLFYTPIIHDPLTWHYITYAVNKALLNELLFQCLCRFHLWYHALKYTAFTKHPYIEPSILYASHCYSEMWKQNIGRAI